MRLLSGILLAKLPVAPPFKVGAALGSNAELAFSATVLIFGIFVLKGDANAGSWSARMVQFFVGCSIAVGMMSLLWPKLQTRKLESGI